MLWFILPLTELALIHYICAWARSLLGLFAGQCGLRWRIIYIMKRINIYLSDKQYEALKALAKNTDVKFAEHVRRAVDKYLASAKRQS